MSDTVSLMGLDSCIAIGQATARDDDYVDLHLVFFLFMPLSAYVFFIYAIIGIPLRPLSDTGNQLLVV